MHDADRTPRVFHRVPRLWTKVTFRADVIHIRSTLKSAPQPPRTAAAAPSARAENADNPQAFYCRYFTFEREENVSERHLFGSVAKTRWSLEAALQRIYDQLLRCSVRSGFCLQDGARAAYHPGRREPHGSNLHWFHSVSLPCPVPPARAGCGGTRLARWHVRRTSVPRSAVRRGLVRTAVPPAWVRPSARREIAARR